MPRTTAQLHEDSKENRGFGHTTLLRLVCRFQVRNVWGTRRRDKVSIKVSHQRHGLSTTPLQRFARKLSLEHAITS